MVEHGASIQANSLVKRRRFTCDYFKNSNICTTPVESSYNLPNNIHARIMEMLARLPSASNDNDGPINTLQRTRGIVPNARLVPNNASLHTHMQ